MSKCDKLIKGTNRKSSFNILLNSEILFLLLWTLKTDKVRVSIPIYSTRICAGGQCNKAMNTHTHTQKNIQKYKTSLYEDNIIV